MVTHSFHLTRTPQMCSRFKMVHISISYVNSKICTRDVTRSIFCGLYFNKALFHQQLPTRRANWIRINYLTTGQQPMALHTLLKTRDGRYHDLRRLWILLENNTVIKYLIIVCIQFSSTKLVTFHVDHSLPNNISLPVHSLLVWSFYKFALRTCNIQ